MQELLKIATDSNLDTLQRVTAREDLAKMLCDEHFQDNEPTTRDIKQVLEHHKLQFTLKPRDILRMWVWKQLDGTPAYAVAKELDVPRNPSEELIQLMINEHIQDLKEQWKRQVTIMDTSSSVGTEEAYETEIQRARALTPAEVVKVLNMCVQYRLPPFAS